MITDTSSGRPVSVKLGIKSDFRVKTVSAPKNYRQMLGPIPNDLVISSKAQPPVDMVHIFSDSRKDMEAKLVKARSIIKKDGMIWVSWPKKNSKSQSDMSEKAIREAALTQGLVDIKVCSVDSKWSALKLVIPKKKRNDA